MTYVVDPLNFARAIFLTNMDRQDKKTDAVFIHGSPAASIPLDEAMLGMAVKMRRDEQVGAIAINGLSDADCCPGGVRMAYPGADTWGKMLEVLGEKEVFKILPSKHTAAESDNFIKLSLQQGWKSVTIMSYPHHILRCMLQMVFCLERAGWPDLKVYTRTMSTVDWQMIVEKGVINGPSFAGRLIDVHMREEYERIIKYANKEGKGYTPHATLEELIAYYERRD